MRRLDFFTIGAEVHRRQLSTRRHLEQVKRELSSWSPQRSTGWEPHGTSQLSWLSWLCFWLYLVMFLCYVYCYVWIIRNLQDER